MIKGVPGVSFRPGVFRSILGCPECVPGVSQDVPGVFRACSSFYSQPFQKTKFSFAFNPFNEESGASNDCFL